MKRMRILIVMLVSLSLILAACQTAAPAEPVEGEEEQIVLEYWSMWNPSEPAALAIQQWIDAFEAENPSIKINATWNGRENQTKLRSALAGGTKVDFMDQDADQITGGLQKEGMGYPLNDFLTQMALDEDITIAETFTPGALDLHKDGNTYYQFPYMNNTWQFWANGDMLEEAGVTEHPQTWDDFLEMAQKLQDAGFNVLAAEGNEFSYNFAYFTYLVERMVGPGVLLAAAADETGEAWNDPVFLQAAQMLTDLWEAGYFPPETEGYIWPAGQMTLATGDAVMELCGSWLPNELRGTAGEDFNWVGLRFPEVEGGEGSIDHLTEWLISFMIMKDTEHPEEVFEFFKFAQTKENAQMMATDAIIGVTRAGVEWPELIKDGEEAAANATLALLPYDGIQAFYPEYQETVLAPAFNELFITKISPEEFIQTMVEGNQSFWN